MSFRRWWVLSVCVAVLLLVLSVVGTLEGWTGWPWEPLVLSVALATATAVGTQSRRVVIPMVAVWAVLACPFPVTSTDGGFASRTTGELRAEGIRLPPSYQGYRIPRAGHAVNDGVRLVNAGPIPAGMLLLRREERSYLDGEGSDADSDLVAYTAGWLPYPHVQRTVVQSLSGNSVDYWIDQERVQLRQDGHRTLVVGHRLHGNAEEVPELRPVGWPLPGPP